MVLCGIKKDPSAFKNEAVFDRFSFDSSIMHLLMYVPAYWLLYWVSGLSLFSGEWFCSFCRDLIVPEMEYESKPEAKEVKKEPDSEGGFHPVDKRVSTL